MKPWTPFTLLAISLFGLTTSSHESDRPSANRNTRTQINTNERQDNLSFKSRNVFSEPTDVGTPLFLTPYIQNGQILQGTFLHSKILVSCSFLSCIKSLLTHQIFKLKFHFIFRLKIN